MKRHDYSPDAFSIYNFETLQQCQAYILKSEKMGYREATVHDGASSQLNKAIRNNDRVVFTDETLAASIWQRLQPFVIGVDDGWHPSGLNERFSFYRYNKYQAFNWHRDQPYRPSSDRMTKFTFMLYLNDNFEGGQTEFDEFKVWPETGMAVCFNHKLRHTGSHVTKGTKYVLRSDVMFELHE